MSSVAATVRRSRSSSPPAATQRSSSTKPSGSRSWNRAVPLGAVVVQLGRAPVADVGAAAPEVVPLDVGNGDTDAEVVGVVGGAELGDRRAGQGGDGVQIGARGEPGGQLGPGDVAGDRAARDTQDDR